MASSSRTLLLCPPSLSSNPTHLTSLLSTTYPRATTDIQMLDRLALSLVALPANTYVTAVLLHDPSEGAPAPPSIQRTELEKIFTSLIPGGKLLAEDGKFAAEQGSAERLDVLMAGYVVDEVGELKFVKPEYAGSGAAAQVTLLPLRRKKKEEVPRMSNGDAPKTIGPVTNGEEPAIVASAPSSTAKTTTPAAKTNGVGFIDFSDLNFEDDELIDEDTLLDESDLAAAIQQPPECAPKPGKRRRACKDCTCGLKEALEEEDAQKRAAADAALAAAKQKAAQGIVLSNEELTEIDFTVKGKVGSCGSCYLGDAFRCAGCPYIGLPAFKPGEQVRIDVMDDQL